MRWNSRLLVAKCLCTGEEQKRITYAPAQLARFRSSQRPRSAGLGWDSGSEWRVGYSAVGSSPPPLRIFGRVLVGLEWDLELVTRAGIVFF